MNMLTGPVNNINIILFIQYMNIYHVSKETKYSKTKTVLKQKYI